MIARSIEYSSNKANLGFGPFGMQVHDFLLLARRLQKVAQDPLLGRIRADRIFDPNRIEPKLAQHWAASNQLIKLIEALGVGRRPPRMNAKSRYYPRATLGDLTTALVAGRVNGDGDASHAKALKLG
jgi:hypothetical protein